MATTARIFILLLVALAFANAQCLSLCSVQPCHPESSGHCPQHPGKTAPASCVHGQFAGTAEMHVDAGLTFIDDAPLAVIEIATDGGRSPGPTVKQPTRLKLQTFRI